MRVPMSLERLIDWLEQEPLRLLMFWLAIGSTRVLSAR